jgi:hypothetical protein
MYTIASGPAEPTIIMRPGSMLSLWITRANRPEWACITLETLCGYVDLTNPKDWTCALVAYMGAGAITLEPMASEPRDRNAVTIEPGQPAPSLILKPGECLDVWCKPEGKVWHARRLLANINANGVRVTAGRGGRAKRGVVRLRAAGPGLYPPEGTWLLDDIARTE